MLLDYDTQRGVVHPCPVEARRTLGKIGELLVAGTQSQEVVVIRPSHGWVPVRLRELWAYRELLYFLVWRDVKVRYKQTVIGIGWAVLQPLFMMVVFSLLFGTLAKLPSDGVPYPVIVFVALLPWNLFARGLAEGSTSLVANERLVTRVYFPRLILPAAAVVAGLVDFAIGFLVLIGLMLYFGMVPPFTILAVPVFLAVALVSSLGIAFWLSAIDARYRDVRYTLSFLTQLWFFATPVAYTLNTVLGIVPDSLKWLYFLNPMVSVVEGFRWALIPGHDWEIGPYPLLSLLVVAALLLGGMYYFRRTERVFADLV